MRNKLRRAFFFQCNANTMFKNNSSF
uniref:Uncharacterized protein n=1 Tax=Anguilla anguilla TaxID=7936 RepID=A0A0E9PNJ5_ANGAN